MIEAGNTETRPRSVISRIFTYWSEKAHRKRAHRGSRTLAASIGFGIFTTFGKGSLVSTLLMPNTVDSCEYFNCSIS
jgi:hypothetical protein